MKVPRIAKLLALAVRFEELLGNGTVKDYADLARLGADHPSDESAKLGAGVAGTDSVLERRNAPTGPLNERALRRICDLVNWADQIQYFERLVPPRAESATRLTGAAGGMAGRPPDSAFTNSTAQHRRAPGVPSIFGVQSVDSPVC